MKGFTLTEMLIVLLIISLLSMLSLPLWQQTNTQMLLTKEQQKLYLFLRQIQARVENSNDVWLLLANRDMEQNKWCLGAQIKNDYLCDCLSPHHCPQEIAAQFYYPYFPEKTMLVSKSYYPKEITRLSGIRNTASTVCFVLQAEQNRTLFSFFNVGSLKVKDYQSLSACVNDGA
ncbi:prepilin-type N-terminal cleavage/methylation domain-containing protein [Caviibacterium pharyngocola]|uniref:Prepilin-type cleavage/methylation domain-containing protein n=1 Tax=Caviibacterium pharyngocola TaxID=28159 RepID=A0A2M8RX72_9PAST|nr:prepilin-type N-terminal cleavage/methylation domain-containing protein [Caviibacterium pharyngocola]PJG83472.1 prepilin-type cleavage/methylation domain-containing protein [Caviibacterium pharyngocola]